MKNILKSLAALALLAASFSLVSADRTPIPSSGSGSATSTFGFITATTTTATSTFAGDVYITGNLRVSGTFFAPVAISSASTINPSTDNTFSLGSTTLRWFEARFGTGTTTVAGVFGIGTTTPLNSLTVATGSIAVSEYAWGTATSTSMTVDWRRANTQNIRISTSAVTITFVNATTTPGAVLKLVICNPDTGTAGAITWGTAIYWSAGTAPTQTTTAKKCDVWSFLATNGSSTNAVIFGSASTGF